MGMKIDFSLTGLSGYCLLSGRHTAGARYHVAETHILKNWGWLLANSQWGNYGLHSNSLLETILPTTQWASLEWNVSNQTLVYCWSCSWSQGQLSCCSHVHGSCGRQGWTVRLEGDSRRCRNCRYIYSLLAGTATKHSLSPGWRGRYAIFSPSPGWLNRHSPDTAVMPLLLRWGAYRPIVQSRPWPSEYLVMRMQCYKRSALP